MKKILLLILTVMILSCGDDRDSDNDPVIGISWRTDTDSEFLTNVEATLSDLGIKYVRLGQVVDSLLPYSDGSLTGDCIDGNDVLKQSYADIVKSSTYAHSNAADIVKGVDAVIFTGGEDIAPTLYRVPAEWHGIEAEKDYNATRDVNDYLLMTYCLDKDIPLLGFCRGAQMLGVVSGATVVQDIPTWFAGKNLTYNYEHRNEKATPQSYRDYAPHDVSLTADSKVAALWETTTVKNCPSWHHQALESVDGTSLKVVGTTTVSGIPMIESIERTDKTLAIGLQYHPEAAYVKHLRGAENAGDFTSQEDARRFFINFIKQVY